MRPSPFTMADGGETVLRGAFDEVDRDQNVTFDLRVTEIDAMMNQAYPADADIAFATRTADLSALPRVTELGAYMGGPFLARVTAEPGADVSVSVPYGNPFSEQWQEYGGVFAYDYLYLPVGDSATILTRMSYVSVETAEAIKGGPIVPLVGVVRTVTIDGADGFTASELASATPTISWGAPTVGTAHGYILSVMRRELLIDSGMTRIEHVATLRTTRSSIRLPPGLLDSGSSYVFQITSACVPSETLLEAPYRRTLPEAFAPSRDLTVQAALSHST